MKYTADFETTTNDNDCRVWACGICEIEDDYKFAYGNSIDWFMDFMYHHNNDTFYFHNLKFDGEFILYALFEYGFKHSQKKKLEPGEFNTLISSMGQFYSLCICFEKNTKVKIYDSLKILPFSVDNVAHGFNLPIEKLDLDYVSDRKVGHSLTQLEIDYLRNDVEIMARALLILFRQGQINMTAGSNALADFKETIGKKNFNRWFPILGYDYDIRQSYKGGFVYVNPIYQNKDVGEGIVLDVNSLYSYVMYEKFLPFGEGIYFEGKYKPDNFYSVYVQMLTCQFDLKPGHIPTIQIKGQRSRFMPTEYVCNSGNDEITLCLTNVDLDLFLEHYYVYNITWHSGWKFKNTNTIFRPYIDKWIKIKNEATQSGNKAMRTLAKLMLNSLYGKFGLNPNVQSKFPIYINDYVRYVLSEPETRNPVYIPVATFVTAYARQITITSAQKCYDRFLYSDTDSIHLLGTEIPEELEIDPIKLGAWKHEATFSRGRFLRAKTYAEEINCEMHITCAGMPNRCYPNVNWDNFKPGNMIPGKLLPQHVKGGIILKEVDFTIKL